MFSLSERHIFGPYFTGSFTEAGEPVMLHADPVPVQRALDAMLDDAEKISGDAQSPNPVQAAQATQTLVAAVISAFNLKPFDPVDKTGCLENEVIGVWNQWVDWTESKKKSGESTPTTSPATASPPDSPTPTKPATSSGS